jgi:hypothetical protein
VQEIGVGKALQHAYVLLINVRQVDACSLAQVLQGLCVCVSVWCMCVCVCARARSTHTLRHTLSLSAGTPAEPAQKQNAGLPLYFFPLQPYSGLFSIFKKKDFEIFFEFFLDFKKNL